MIVSIRSWRIACHAACFSPLLVVSLAYSSSWSDQSCRRLAGLFVSRSSSLICRRGVSVMVVVVAVWLPRGQVINRHVDWLYSCLDLSSLDVI